MEETKKENFLSRIKGKIKSFFKEIKKIVAEDSELSPEERKELERIIAVGREIHGGKGTQSAVHKIKDEASMEEFINNFEERVHGGKGSQSVVPEMQDEASIEKSLNKFQERVHGGKIVEPAKIDEKAAKKAAEGKTTGNKENSQRGDENL